MILWLVEPTSYIGAGERHIAEQLKNCKLPVILVINKVDTVKKSEIAGFIDGYRKLYNFSDIVPASALRAQNLDTVLDCIFKYLPYGPMFYDEDTITDQPQRQIVAEMIREKALRTLDEEIPHGIAVTAEYHPNEVPFVCRGHSFVFRRFHYNGVRAFPFEFLG